MLMRSSKRLSTRGARRSLRARRVCRKLAAVAAFLTLGGCLLETRNPGEPEAPSVCNWITPEALGNGLSNMTCSLEAKVLTNYERTFSEESLEMTLDPADEGELGGNPMNPWTAAQEAQRMSGILNSARAAAAELTVQWTLSDSVDEGQSQRYYDDLGYRLTFAKGDSVADYSGKVQMWFEDDGTGQWFIVKWIDKRDGSGRRTWGWLRASNRVEFTKR